MLLAGMPLIFVGVHEIKDAVDRPRPAGGAGRRRRLLLPQRPRRLLDPLRLAGGDDRPAPAAGHGARRRRRRRRHRADGAGRPLARLPRRPLPQRRQRRLGAGRRLLLLLRRRRAGHHHRAAESRSRDCRSPCRRSSNEYLLFGVAGLVSLVAFVGLILVPALSAYGRIWEKAAAGVLSIFVLAALVVTGVVIGLVIVYYYNDIVNLLNGTWRLAPGRGIMARCQQPQRPRKALQKRKIRGLSTRSPMRSSRAPACPRSPARRRKVLDASVALIDRSSAVLAVAGASPGPGEEAARRRRGRDPGRAAGRRQPPSASCATAAKAAPDPAIARMVTTLLALELERSRSPEWESEEVAGAFVAAVLAREVTDRGDILARAAELGADLEQGAGVLIAPRGAACGAERRVARAGADPDPAGAALARPGLAGDAEEGEAAAELAVIVPAEDDERLARAAAGLARELDDSLAGFHLTIGRSRRAADPVDLYRAGNEARLAVNVGEAEGRPLLAFEDTGSYRLLLPAMSEDPRELERFYAETIAPLSAYDEQYETELVTTVEAYLDNDGNVAATAKQLFTHRHTDPLPAGAGQRALRPRRLRHRGPREARPRAQNDARPRHRLAERPGDGARLRSAARCPRSSEE